MKQKLAFMPLQDGRLMVYWRGPASHRGNPPTHPLVLARPTPWAGLGADCARGGCERGR
jgi:hypothetical protein